MPVHRPEHKRPGVAFGPAQLKAASAGRKPPRKAVMAPPKPVRGVRGAVKGAVKAVAARSKASLNKEVAAIREVIHGKEVGKFIDALQKARSGPALIERDFIVPPLMDKVSAEWKRLHRKTPTRGGRRKPPAR